MNINYNLIVNPVKVTDYLTTKAIKKRRFNPLDIYTAAQICGKVTDGDIINLATFLARALLKKLYEHSANKEIYNRRIELEKAILMLSRHDGDGDEKPDIIPYAYDYVNQFVAEILANQTAAATLLTEFTDYKPNKHVIAQGKKTAALVETTETPLQVIWRNVRKYINAQNLRADRSVYSYVSIDDYSDDDDDVTYAADKVYYRFYKYSDVCDVVHSAIQRKKAKDNVPKTTAAANIDDWIYFDNIIDALKLTKRELHVLKYRLQGLSENDIVTTMNKPKKRKNRKTGEYITDDNGIPVLFPPKSPITRNAVHGALMRIRKKALAIGLTEKTMSKYIDGVTPGYYCIKNVTAKEEIRTVNHDEIDFIISQMAFNRFTELKQKKIKGKFTEKISISGYNYDLDELSNHYQFIEFDFTSSIPDYRIITE